MSSVHMYFRCLFLPASLVIHHSNMVSQEQWPQKPHIPYTKHSCQWISVFPSTIGNRNNLANCSSFLGHPGTDSGLRIANLWQVQTRQFTYLVFLSQKHDVEIKHSKEKAHKKHGWWFCFSLWYNLDEPQDGKYTVSWMWRMMHLSQTTSLDLPKAQWERIMKRLPTLQENLWNLSVWADKRSAYNSFHRRCQTCSVPILKENESQTLTKIGAEWRVESKISHKKSNPQINLPSYRQYAQPVSSEWWSCFIWGQKSTCRISATPILQEWLLVKHCRPEQLRHLQ